MQVDLGNFRSSRWRAIRADLFLDKLGQLCVEHGQGYPTNQLRMKEHHEQADFLRILVITCTGLKISKGAQGVSRIMLLKPMAFSFEHKTYKHAEQ